MLINLQAMSETEKYDNVHNSEVIHENSESGTQIDSLSSEERLEALSNEIPERQEQIDRIKASKEKSIDELKRLRDNLGVPHTEEDVHSISSSQERIDQLQSEKEALEKQQEELLLQQERKRLIDEEKANIIQEKIAQVFAEFKSLDQQDLSSILNTGHTFAGQVMESRALGSLNPDVAQQLVRAFNEGLKLLPQILERFPGIVEQLDDELTEEAEKRVDLKLEAEANKVVDTTEIDEEESEEDETATQPTINVPPNIPGDQT